MLKIVFLAHSCSTDNDKSLSIEEKGNCFKFFDISLNQPKLDIYENLMRVQVSCYPVKFSHINLERKIFFVCKKIYIVHVGLLSGFPEVYFLFLPCTFQKLNSDLNAWWQSSLPQSCFSSLENVSSICTTCNNAHLNYLNQSHNSFVS